MVHYKPLSISQHCPLIVEVVKEKVRGDRPFRFSIFGISERLRNTIKNIEIWLNKLDRKEYGNVTSRS